MSEYCEIFLEKAIYAPGENVKGRVHCHFLHENDVRNIYLRFKGKAKVQWKEGKQHRFAEEVYFEMESPLLQDRTAFPPGDYDYPFSFSLKGGIPSSTFAKHGEIKYTAVAVVDRPFSLDYKSEKEFQVFSPNILHYRQYDQPLEVAKDHIPFWNYFSSSPIRLSINMRKRNYHISEMVTFSAKLENYSSISVKSVHFQLVQGFIYYANDHDIVSDDWEGQEYAIVDSAVPPNSDKIWDLEIRIPKDMFAGYIWICKIMKPLWELHGEVVLPFPNSNFKIKIPIHVGVAEDS